MDKSPFPLNMEKVEDLVAYLHERERIRIKKENNEAKPWTRHKVLQENRFTNVLRQDDKTTRWLWKRWLEPNYGSDPVNEMMSCAIYRWFGTIRFGELLGYHKPFDLDHVHWVAADARCKGETIFTSAYVITNGGVSGPKEEVVINHYLKPLRQKAPELVQVALDTRSWEAVSKVMAKVPGHGGQGFMRKELISDMMATSMFIEGVEDKYTWTPMGPGARRGMNRLRDRDADRSMREDLYLQEVRELYEVLKDKFEPWMPQPYELWCLHSCQFALCEFDKYLRVINGEGRMKNRYNGRA